MSLRLRQIALVARDRDRVVATLERVLGLAVGHVDPGVAQFGLHNALLPVGDQFLEVVAPVQEGTTAGRYLDRRGGDGGYMVILQCDDHAPVKRQVEALGIRKVLEFDVDDYSCMQLHPRDTGGSFLEVDHQGPLRAAGPWWPAGTRWQAAVRTERVDAVTAAEIQSPDPEALAARWGAILGLTPAADAAGRPTLALAGATLRFVADADGRGEGLGGIDLRARDRAAVVAAATAAGLVVEGDVVALGGVRMRLVG